MDNWTRLSLQKKEETTDDSTSMSKNIDGNFKVSPMYTNHEKPDLLAFINNKNDEEELLNGPINPLSDEENLVIQIKDYSNQQLCSLECVIPLQCSLPVRATVERLSRDLAGDPKHIYKHKYDRKAHLAGDPKRKG